MYLEQDPYIPCLVVHLGSENVWKGMDIYGGSLLSRSRSEFEIRIINGKVNSISFNYLGGLDGSTPCQAIYRRDGKLSVHEGTTDHQDPISIIFSPGNFKDSFIQGQHHFSAALLDQDLLRQIETNEVDVLKEMMSHIKSGSFGYVEEPLTDITVTQNKPDLLLRTIHGSRGSQLSRCRERTTSNRELYYPRSF